MNLRNAEKAVVGIPIIGFRSVGSKDFFMDPMVA